MVLLQQTALGEAGIRTVFRSALTFNDRLSESSHPLGPRVRGQPACSQPFHVKALDSEGSCACLYNVLDSVLTTLAMRHHGKR